MYEAAIARFQKEIETEAYKKVHEDLEAKILTEVTAEY